MNISVKDFIPPVFLKLLRSSGVSEYYIDKSGNRLHLPEILGKNEVLKNIHQGKRCFIVGTGSSIKKQNLKLLKNEFCIGLNEFFLHDDYSEIKPQYTVFSGFGIHNVPTEKHLSWYQNYEQTITGISQPLINICDYSFIQKNSLLKKSDVKFMHFQNGFEKLEQNGIDATQTLYASSSVSVMALQLALYMGFKEIFLVGFDHDWLLRMFDKQPTHFYNHDKSIIYKGHNEVEGISVLSELKSNVNLFSNYTFLKEYADKHNVAVYNATEGGMLDVFPRVKFESTFEKNS
jgi:hypothetical protein